MQGNDPSGEAPENQRSLAQANPNLKVADSSDQGLEAAGTKVHQKIRQLGSLNAPSAIKKELVALGGFVAAAVREVGLLETHKRCQYRCKHHSALWAQYATGEHFPKGFSYSLYIGLCLSRWP